MRAEQRKRLELLESRMKPTPAPSGTALRGLLGQGNLETLTGRALVALEEIKRHEGYRARPDEHTGNPSLHQPLTPDEETLIQAYRFQLIGTAVFVFHPEDDYRTYVHWLLSEDRFPGFSIPDPYEWSAEKHPAAVDLYTELTRLGLL